MSVKQLLIIRMSSSSYMYIHIIYINLNIRQLNSVTQNFQNTTYKPDAITDVKL